MALLGPNDKSPQPLQRVPLCKDEPSILDEQTVKDIADLVGQAIHEVAGTVQVKKFDKTTNPNPVYKESTQKKFLALIEAKATIEVNPSAKSYMVHGIREQVDVMLTFASVDLDALGLTITTDDRVVVFGKEYNVYQVNPENFVQNTPMRFLVTGKIWTNQGPIKGAV